MRTAAPFLRDDSGSTITLFAVMLLPLFAFAGVAVDFARARSAQTYLGTTADAQALTVGASDDPTVGTSSEAAVRTAVQTRYPAIQNLTVTATWADAANYQVTIQGNLPTTLLQAVPYMPKTMTVSSLSMVKRIPAVMQTEPPKLSQLDPEAGDYNRIYLYCYDVSRKSAADKGRRAETMIAISDNGGTTYNLSGMKPCQAGETVSYRLHNVRNMRTTPSRWDDPTVETYDYFTDTAIDPVTRVQTMNMVGQRTYATGSPTALDMRTNPILETILCDTEAQCKPKNQGGILPNNHETGRTPAVATGGCAEGKLMYYGWEDRPPNMGSDTDYDDIRLVVTCPKMIKVQDKQVRLVK